GQAREGGGQDRQRPHGEVLRRGGAARAAVHQEPRPVGAGPRQREDRQDRREHPGASLLALQARRGHREAERRLRCRGGGTGGELTIPQPIYRRVLLKLSGEALMGSQPFGIDEAMVATIADELREVWQLGTQ